MNFTASHVSLMLYLTYCLCCLIQISYICDSCEMFVVYLLPSNVACGPNIKD